MMQETYVSVWDDDIIAKSQWLEFSVDFSKKHGNALVAANGRTFIEIYKDKVSKREELIGRNDLGGHIWTLPREFLKYYLEMKMPTRYTGEDILISYALQKRGIDTMVPKMEGEKSAVNNYTFGNDKNSSHKTNQTPRMLLFCKLLKDGFETIKCKNCKDEHILNKCIKHFTKKAQVAEQKATIEDRKNNNNLVWSGISRK